MFSESTHLYDLIYGEFKDFLREGREVGKLIQREAPHATSVLDVGCGTGRHALVLIREFDLDVHGLDLEPRFLDIARKRCPAGTFHHQDMADFNLDRTFHVILCLFSSIGYVRTRDKLDGTARCFFQHLDPGGLLLVEPWFTPDRYSGGSVFLHTVDKEELKVSRMSRSEVVGRISRLDFHYLVGDSEGIRHLREIHELGLFTEAEMTASFQEAGFDEVRFHPQGLTDRGLYLARKPGNATEDP